MVRLGGCGVSYRRVGGPAGWGGGGGCGKCGEARGVDGEKTAGGALWTPLRSTVLLEPVDHPETRLR